MFFNLLISTYIKNKSNLIDGNPESQSFGQLILLF